MQKLRNNGYVLHLTKVKRLEVITFMGKRYVSFVQISYHKDNEYKRYINFNDDEWATLFDKMSKINNKLFGKDECHGTKTSIYHYEPDNFCSKCTSLTVRDETEPPFI